MRLGYHERHPSMITLYRRRRNAWNTCGIPLKNPSSQTLRCFYYFYKIKKIYRINGTSYLLIIYLDPRISIVDDYIIRYLSFV
jgi:hypothetical protein